MNANMKTDKHNSKHNFTIMFVLLSIIMIIVTSMAPSIQKVKAAPEEEEGLGCIYCSNNKEVYPKEHQLIRKVRIIKSIFPNAIDEVVLMATVMHRFPSIDMLNKQYDEEFDEYEYKNSWNDAANNTTDAASNDAHAIDILNAATIIMLDSSGFTGRFDQDKYQEYLAKDKLIGNGTIAGVGDALNAITCGAGGLIDIIATPVQIIKDAFGGKDISTTFKEKQQRWVTMYGVCTQGYVGGVYDGIADIKDPDAKQKAKEVIAQEIIDLAELYRQIFGDSRQDCPVGNTQTSVFDDLTTDEYIAIMGPIAQADYSRSGIFASITLAQSMIESGWGKKTPQDSNNMFGMKCTDDWKPNCVDALTWEFKNGGWVQEMASWKVYDSVEASVADHGLLFEKERYVNAGVLTAATPQEQARAIHAAGYATSPSYADSIINQISYYNLEKWDVKKNTTSSSAVCSPVGAADWAIRTIAPTASDPAFNYISSNRGQCVWYAQGRAIEIVEELGTRGKMTNDDVDKIRDLLLRAYGHGGQIYDNAKSVFNSSNDVRQPKSGSYIVWKQPGGYGHVAVVDEVNQAAGTITITEGWATGTMSCPSNWSCVNFLNTTMDLDVFYSSYGPHYNGNYNFSGYIYFLEPLS